VKALRLGIDGIVSALEELCDQNKIAGTRGQAHDMLDVIQRVSFVFYTLLEGSSERVSRCPKIFAAKRFVIGELCPEDKSICSLLE